MTSCRQKWHETQKYDDSISRSNWTVEDDALLKGLVNEYGANKWNSISRLFNRFTKTGKKTSRQCRDRWINFVNPLIKRTKATFEETIKLCETFLLYGKRWSIIAKTLNRTEHWVKKHWKKVIKGENGDPQTLTDIEIKEKLQGIIIKIQNLQKGNMKSDKKYEVVSTEYHIQNEEYGMIEPVAWTEEVQGEEYKLNSQEGPLNNSTKRSKRKKEGMHLNQEDDSSLFKQGNDPNCDNIMDLNKDSGSIESDINSNSDELYYQEESSIRLSLYHH